MSKEGERQQSQVEKFEGGILGLLLLTNGSDDLPQTDLVRLASTFRLASMEQIGMSASASRLAPIVRFRMANAQKLLNAPLSELDTRHLEYLQASKTCRLKEMDVHRPLSDHLDAIEKLRNNRTLSFSVVKERERSLNRRFARSVSGSTAIVQSCVWEGAKAIGEVRPPTGVLIRLDPGERGKDESASPSDVLIGRPAWRKALYDVRMPKFGENKVSLIELISASAVPMSSVEEFGEISSKEVVDAVMETKPVSNLRDFLKFMSSSSSFDEETWKIVCERIAALVDASKGEKQNDGPDVVAKVESASWIPSVQKGMDLIVRIAELTKPKGKTSADEGDPSIGGAEEEAEEKDKTPEGCDLDPLPERPLKSWISDPDPEAPGVAPSEFDAKEIKKQYVLRSKFWEEYSIAISDASPKASVSLGVAQGHLRLSGPVVLASPGMHSSSIPVYDHIRAVEPRGVCRSFLAKAIEKRSADDAEEFREILKEADEDLTHVVDLSIAWKDHLSFRGRGKRDRTTFFKIKEPRQAIFDTLEYRDDELELGIEDVFFYREVEREKKSEDDDEGANAKGFDPDSPSNLLQEMAALLGVSPPLDVTEERSILDELEYHLPGGEGEEARLLRKRIDDVKRRRNELMAKANVGGKAYQAVEKRLIDRLRRDSAVKIVAEKVSFLAALLANKAGDRIAESPSGALRACLALPADKRRAIERVRHPKTKQKFQPKKKIGGANVDLTTLLSCAGSTVIGTRCPPDAPPPRDASAIELAKKITAIEATLLGDEGAGDEPSKAKRVRQAVQHSNRMFRPFPEVEKSSESPLSSLWSHVRGSKTALDGAPINPVSSCCSYDSEDRRGVWNTIDFVSTPATTASPKTQRAIVGIQPARALEAYRSLPNKQASYAEFTPVNTPSAILVNLQVVAVAVEDKKEKNTLAAVRNSDPTLERELVPPSGDEGSLANETKMRIEDLLGPAKEGEEAYVADVREVLSTTERIEIASILSSFLRSELGPTLRKMSAPEITSSLSADVEIAKCSADLREPETRARFAALSDACAAAASARSYKNATTAFLIWALSKAGKGLPQKSEEAATHAADVMMNRLSKRLEFGRSDRKDVDANKVKAVKEALRAAKRAALDHLKDEDRELYGELKMAIRGVSAETIAATTEDDSAAIQEVEKIEEARSDEETIEDARDSFF